MLNKTYDEHQQLIIKQSRFYSYVLIIVLLGIFAILEKTIGNLFSNPLLLVVFPIFTGMSFYIIRNTNKDAFIPLDGFQNDFSIYYLLIGIELFCSVIPLLLFITDISFFLQDTKGYWDGLLYPFLFLSIAIEAIVMWRKLYTYKKLK